MWFQIELPQPARVTEVQIDTALPFSFGGRGRAGGGRGARPAARRRRAVRRRRRQAAAARRFRSPAPVAYTLQVSMDGSAWGSPGRTGQRALRRPR